MPEPIKPLGPIGRAFLTRKVLVTLIILGAGLAVTFIKGDIPANLLQLLSIIFGGFIVGNVGEYAAGAFKKVPNQQQKQPDQPQSTPPEIKEHLTKQDEALSTIQQTLIYIIEKTGLKK